MTSLNPLKKCKQCRNDFYFLQILPRSTVSKTKMPHIFAKLRKHKYSNYAAACVMMRVSGGEATHLCELAWRQVSSPHYTLLERSIDTRWIYIYIYTLPICVCTYMRWLYSKHCDRTMRRDCALAWLAGPPMGRRDYFLSSGKDAAQTHSFSCSRCFFISR